VACRVALPAAVSWQLLAMLVVAGEHDVVKLVAEANAVAKQTVVGPPAEPFAAHSAVAEKHAVIAVFAKLLPELNLGMEGQQEEHSALLEEALAVLEEDLPLLEMHDSNPASNLLQLDSSLLPKWSMLHWLNTAFALQQVFPAQAKDTKPLQV